MLTGKSAFVTGATRGIGLAIARALEGAGARVIAGCRDASDVTVGEPHVCHLEDPTLPDAPLDVLVHNAGIWEATPVDGDAFRETWDRVIALNLTSAAVLSRLFAEKHAGAIVHISSRASHRGEAGYAAYAASKAGVNALTKSLAVELGPKGTRVNAVAPGWVRTDMTEEALAGPGLPEPIPLGRIAEPDDVAGPVLFLCSDLSRYVTGVVLDVTGGSYLR